MDAKQITEALRQFHTPDHWCFMDELRVSNGFVKDNMSRIDFWAIHYLPSRKNLVRSFEIKVSRGDYFHELAVPNKRRPALRLSNQYFFVTPVGLVKPEEVPLDCGLIEVTDTYQLKIVVPAPYREHQHPPTWAFIASLCRRFDKEYFKEWKRKQKERDAEKQYEYVARKLLREHIDKWKNHNIGSREVPLQIAKALESLLIDVEESIETGRLFDEDF